jgi:hypothetical protein
MTTIKASTPTDRPWVAGELLSEYAGRQDEIPIYTAEQGDDGPLLATVWPMGDEDSGEREANAELIVTAVNQHDTLIQLVKEAYSLLNSLAGHSTDPPVDLRDWLKEARKLI